MIKCFHSSTATRITVVNYGPYDNGHICVGFSTGHVLILNSFDLASIYRTEVFQSPDPTRSIPVNKIIFDPLNMMIVSSEEQFDTFQDGDTEELTYLPLLAGLSLIESQADYKYLQMGPQSFMTLVIEPQANQRHRSRGTRSKSRGLRSNTLEGQSSSAFGCFD